MLINRILLSVILMLMMVPMAWSAQRLNVDLAAEHGLQLTSAPFVIRYKFEHETGRKWTDSTFSQREAFLTDWYIRIAESKTKQDAKIKEITKEEAERQKQAQTKEKFFADRKKNRLNKENVRKKAELDKKKEFDRQVSEQNKKITRMRAEQRKLFNH